MNAVTKKTIWGLTGGIAAGKSLAARFFIEAGIPVIDADQISRELSQPEGAAYEAITQEFGTADRAKLREIVFNDPSARQKLEAILHPLIQAESIRRMLLEASPWVIYEASLLVETGRYKDFAGLLLVDSPRELRKNRLVSRDGLSPELAEKILNAQSSNEERRNAATVIFANTGSTDELRQKVLKFMKDQHWVI